ncbi:MAG: DUF5683 domain-containing protein [Bacteroidota bacterium]
MQVVFILFFIFLNSISASAQVTDSTKSKDPDPKSETALKPVKPYHSPKKAAIMSAIVPGLGQIYNKKYWKVPLIYAGIAGLAYSYNLNQSKYISYRTAFKARVDTDSTTTSISDYDKYSNDNLYTLLQSYQRYRNLTVIGGALLYLINVVDASVDAHLFTFDVNDDLSFNIQPVLLNSVSRNEYTTGFSLSIKF